MAIELLPLLTDDSPPPVPGGEYIPPTSASDQDTADVIAEYLDYLNPDLRTSSLAYMTWGLAGSVWTAFQQAGSALKTALGQAGGALESGWGALGNAVGAIHTAVDLVQNALGHTPGTATVIERIDAISTGGSNSWWGTVPFDPTNPEWVLVGTDTFTDAIHFEEVGHVYIVTAIAPFASRSEEIIDAETIYFGLGWIAEMAGNYRGQRSYLDFESNVFHREGHLMRGALVNFPKGGDGQISAYRYTPA